MTGIFNFEYSVFHNTNIIPENQTRENNLFGLQCVHTGIEDSYYNTCVMTVFELKLLALVCMIIDHIGAFLLEMPVQLRWIGRIAAPIFIFCLCEGIDHTRSKKKYVLRLYIAGVLMSFMQMAISTSANIFRTLFHIAVICIIIKMFDKDTLKARRYLCMYLLWQVITIAAISYIWMKISQSWVIRAVIPAISGSLAFTEGGVPLVVFGIMLYLTKNNKRNLCIGFLVFDIVYAVLSLTQLTTLLLSIIQQSSIGSPKLIHCIRLFFGELFGAFAPGRKTINAFTRNYQWMMIASLPFMLTYNGKKGKSLKWFFYIFYPVHILILWYIASSIAS